MNRRRWEMVVLWAGVIVIALMCLLPPHDKGDDVVYSGGGHIDYGRLLVRCAIVALLTGAGIYTFRTKGK